MKNKLDLTYDYDKTTLKTIESCRKELVKLALVSDDYWIAIVDLDNFKKMNTKPMDYE